ncbi:MAG: hypothetical protein J5880_01055 [Bacilli bacterium]|nr:hypothetical protein [Bacilli bacterium]MBO4682782.1 hypothetical protein [Bacilli bacterium]
MKSLKIIQVLAVICRVICIIVFVACIIGAVGCLLGFTILPIVKDVVVHDGKTIAELIAEDGKTTVETIIAGCGVGLFGCGVEIFLAKYNELFYKKEIAVGTPFNKEIVRDMRILALVNILVSLTAVIMVGIALGIVRALVRDVQHFNNYIGTPIGYGIALLVISLFCDYGAELNNKPEVMEAEISEEPKEE